jgi:hypothetical protein
VPVHVSDNLTPAQVKAYIRALIDLWVKITEKN